MRCWLPSGSLHPMSSRPCSQAIRWSWAAPDLVIVVSQRVRRGVQQRYELGLALNQRHRKSSS